MQNGRSLKWFPCFQQRALSNPCKFVLQSVDSLTCEGIFKPTLRAAFARIQVFLSQSCVWFDVFASTGWWLTRTIQPGLVAYKLELAGTDFRFPCPGHGRPEKLPGTFYAISDLFSEWLWNKMVGAHGPSQCRKKGLCVSRSLGTFLSSFPLLTLLCSCAMDPCCGRGRGGGKKKVTLSKAVNDNPEWRKMERKLVFSRLIPYWLLNDQPLVLSLLTFWWPFTSSVGLPERSSWLISCCSSLPFALVSGWTFPPSFSLIGISGDIKLFVTKVFC